MRLLLKTFAILGLCPYVGVVLLLVTGRASWSSVAYVIALGVLLGGLVTLPDPARDEGDGEKDAKKSRRPRGLSRGAVVALALIAIVRTITAGEGRSLRVGEGGGRARGELGSARFVNRLVDEGDVAVAGTRVLVASGMLQDDRVELPTAMDRAYGAMRGEQGDSPSPFAATYLGLERPTAFDVTMIDPPQSAGGAAPTSGVIFLHGYAGNFDLPCWQVARAVASTGAVTACPSTRWIGDWWTPEGEATVRAAVELLRARGVERIVLAGLSNGGYGVSRLAPRMKGTFAGVVMISGAVPDAPSAGVPALVIHGKHDTMASYEDSRAYASRTGAKLVTLDAGHFAMLVRAEESDRALRDFVAARATARASR